MKKTISVNIANFVFNIEEDAYQQLDQYLKSIRSRFSNEEEAEEIMADIERRIAELFQAEISDSKEVITGKDVATIQEQLGAPSDFTDETEAESQTAEETQEEPLNEEPIRRLFRDKENARIGGVAAGLGHYFKLDPVIFRVLFIILALAGLAGVIVYIILIYSVPEAKTTAQKLQMRGESVNINTIQEHIQEVRESVKKGGSNLKENMNSSISKGIETGRTVFSGLSRIIGAVFVFFGLFLIVFLTLIYLGHAQFIPIIGENNMFEVSTLIDIVFSDTASPNLIYISLIIASFIPIIILVLTGFRLAVNSQHRFKNFFWGSFVIWCIAVAILFFKSIDLSLDFRSRSTISNTLELENPQMDTLHISLADDPIFSNHFDPNQTWGTFEQIKTDESQIHFSFPEVNIVNGLNDENFRIRIIRQSRGRNQSDAITLAENIIYAPQLNGNQLTIPAYYSVSRADKIRVQHVSVEISVPFGKIITFDDQIDRLEIDIDGVDHLWNRRFSSSNWINYGTDFYCTQCNSSINDYLIKINDIPDTDTSAVVPEQE